MKRSDEILLVGYWLSRRSNPVTGAPPAARGVRYWKQAYESFAHLKGGRTLPTFIN